MNDDVRLPDLADAMGERARDPALPSSEQPFFEFLTPSQSEQYIGILRTEVKRLRAVAQEALLASYHLQSIRGRSAGTRKVADDLKAALVRAGMCAASDSIPEGLS